MGMKILISDSLSKQGVELLEKAGFTVVVKSKMPKDELFREIKDADGLIVRSGTKVTECRYSCGYPSGHCGHEYAGRKYGHDS
jgi:phosphoglycerate dehydrogenase-like enzyme